jgi:hypothetical protein
MVTAAVRAAGGGGGGGFTYAPTIQAGAVVHSGDLGAELLNVLLQYARTNPAAVGQLVAAV